MKILTLSYYGSFSRYFNYLISNLRKEEDIIVYNLSLYPTAHIQWKRLGEQTVFLPKEIRKRRKLCESKEVKFYKGINLEEIISYHRKTLSLPKDHRHSIKLKEIALLYVDYYDELFKNEQFDVFISSGDTRMFVSIPIILANKYNVKVYYFEQGPFKTTVFDEKGVNVNSSFRQKTLDQKHDREKVTGFIDRKKQHPFYKSDIRYYIHKTLDSILLAPPIKRLSFLELVAEQSFIELFSRNLRRVSGKVMKDSQEISLPNKFFLLILQVPYDAQMILYSPLFDNVTDMVKEVYENLPQNYELVVREHPMYRGMYDNKMYKYIENNKILLINDTPLNYTIELSSAVVVNNSTVGIEVLRYYKPLIMLGNSYYDSHGIGYKVESLDVLGKLLNKAVSSEIPKSVIDTFLYNLLFDYLYEGHFTDNELKSGEKIAEKILANFHNKNKIN